MVILRQFQWNLIFSSSEGTETKVVIMNQEILIVIIRDLISLSREDNLVETINSDRGNQWFVPKLNGVMHY